MKKQIFGFVLVLSLLLAPVTGQAFFGSLGNAFSNTVGSISNAVNSFSSGNILGGISNGLNALQNGSNLVNGVRSIFGGGSSGGGGYYYGGGSTSSNFSYGGSSGNPVFSPVSTGGFNLSGGTVISANFDNVFDGINGGSGVTPDGAFELPDADKFNRIGENTSLRQYILNVLNFTLTFLGLIAVAMVIYAGYLYVVSVGDDSNMEKSKKIIIFAVIGILVVLASYALVNTIIKNAGIGGDDRDGASGTPLISGGTPSTPTVPGTTVNPTTEGVVVTGNDGRTTVINPDGTSTDITDLVENDPGAADSLFNDVSTLLIIKSLKEVEGSGIESLDIGSGLNDDSNRLNNEEEDELLEDKYPNGGVQDFGGTSVAVPEVARKGLAFTLGIQARAIIDFGDRTQAILDTTNDPEAFVKHQFGEEKSYLIRAIIQTLDGKQIPVRKDLVVGGTNAYFNMNKSRVVVGEILPLDASATTTSIGSISNYKWYCKPAAEDEVFDNIRDEENVSRGCFAGTFGQQAEVKFSAPGRYEVNLEVHNVVGMIDTFTRIIQVITNKPTAEFDSSSTNNSNKPAEFRFNARQSINTAGTNQGLVYFWNFDGDFQQSNSPEINYEFKTTGSKKVELVVVESYEGGFLRSEPLVKTVNVETTVPIDFEVN